MLKTKWVEGVKGVVIYFQVGERTGLQVVRLD